MILQLGNSDFLDYTRCNLFCDLILKMIPFNTSKDAILHWAWKLPLNISRRMATANARYSWTIIEIVNSEDFGKKHSNNWAFEETQNNNLPTQLRVFISLHSFCVIWLEALYLHFLRSHATFQEIYWISLQCEYSRPWIQIFIQNIYTIDLHHQKSLL